MTNAFSSKQYKIINTRQLTENVRLIRVKSDINPMPGQFFQVSIPGIGECPLASCSYNNKFIDILLKNAGNLSSQIFKMKTNESISIRGPYGNGFPIEKIKNKNIIIIAGGTGIAPVASFIEYIDKNRKDFKDIFIYFGFRDDKNILLKDRINKYKKKFKLRIALSETRIHEYEKGFVQDIMDKHKPETENTVALLCGPEPMMYAVTQELKKLEIKNNNIFWSMERRMECGFGSCGRCQIQDLYVCRDGPVFSYDIIKPRLDNEESNEK